MVEPSSSAAKDIGHVENGSPAKELRLAKKEGRYSKRRKRYSDYDDPERQRLKAACRVSLPTHFLPHTQSIGVGKFSFGGDDGQQHAQHAHALRALFYMIVAKLTRVGSGGGVTWGEGVDEDPRRRMYGFMPHQREALLRAGIKIQKEGAPDDREHEEALQWACVDFVFPHRLKQDPQENSNISTDTLILDKSVYDALAAMTARVHALVPVAYKKYVTMEQLVAAQPNLHNGASYLPAHLDFPRQDGFGVVIVTFGVRGMGTIVLIDDGDEDDEDKNEEEGGGGSKSYSFRLEENEAYILCGDSRNKCVHGVLCRSHGTDQEHGDDECRRETLNLRYGLHSPEYAMEEIDQYWPE